MNDSFLKFLTKKIKKRSKPWEYWQIDNFFPPEAFASFQQKILSKEYSFLQRDDDEAQINYIFLPDVNLASFFLSEAFNEFLEEVTGQSLSIYQESLVQLRKMTPSSPEFPIHIDSQDKRSLVCLFYISEDWRQGCGGELCLFENEQLNSKKLPDQIISPLANRMVLFFSDDNHWHSVNKVHDWTRYCVVSEWIVE
jgi:Rps23 Pro-64 3,4-dihydroxylase Tpa1-like proline 4-hydroxylase